MKNTTIIAVLSFTMLMACSTVKQARIDFNNFRNTVIQYNMPKERKGWNKTCPYCAPYQKCKWYKCPNVK